MASNAAAWLSAEKSRPFEVKSAPLWIPGENEILICNRAIAINPIDGNFQAAPEPRWSLTYPMIPGSDVSGVVVSIGPNVTRFKEGDRVLGHGVGMFSRELQGCAFQKYTILRTNMASKIPDNVTFESAAVIPLGISTAACGLFQDTFLNLQFPTVPSQKQTGKTLLIWGGASSVGSNAVQLAVSAGYEVITTSSPKNFEYVKKLGASQVFDYHSATVSADLVDALAGKTLVGAFDCIGQKAWDYCTDVVQRCTGNKLIATTKRGYPPPPDGVTIMPIMGVSLKDNEVGEAVYRHFLPKALEAGTFIPAPSAFVAGHGLESLQDAVDIYRRGTSAKKVVVTL
ncbi:hypothetical protein V492_06672 [Pseudogymnoascus sp. VKM F-4246]|nr:hypothetical protein V492_06672 [Pseudogymnoascus sp. VKM F-4246]